MTMLIADSGSTKTHWELVATDTAGAQRYYTQGISPFYQSADEIFKILESELFPHISEHFIDRIFFYGTGCSQPDKIEVVYNALNKSFPQAQIFIEHDLLAAAKGACGNEPGIACILGTGSNSCLFNGKDIIDNVPSLGFMLGDEASGAYFGRKILQAFFYREIPHELADKFKTQFSIDKAEVLNNVYQKPNPNRYVGSFMPFLNENNSHPFIHHILTSGFNEFIERMIVKYEGHQHLPVHFIGSVAYLNQAILSACLAKYNLKVGRFLRSPVEGLVEFHLKNELK